MSQPGHVCANASWLTWSVIHHILSKLMEVDAGGNYQASPVYEEAPGLENGLITDDPPTEMTDRHDCSRCRLGAAPGGGRR